MHSTTDLVGQTGEASSVAIYAVQCRWLNNRVDGHHMNDHGTRNCASVLARNAI